MGSQHTPHVSTIPHTGIMWIVVYIIYETKGVNDIDYNPHDTSVRYGRNMRCVLGLCVDGNNSSDKNGTKICVGTGDGFVRVYRERNKEGSKENKLELLTELRKHKGPVVCL